MLKWVMAGVGYLSLITFMAYASINKAIDETQKMGEYQIQQTLIYQGEEKAQELRAWRNKRMGVEESLIDSEATDTPKQ